MAGSDLGTSGALAPVRLPGDKAARTYSAAQLKTFERTGGDPAVLAYWTPEPQPGHRLGDHVLRW